MRPGLLPASPCVRPGRVPVAVSGGGSATGWFRDMQCSVCGNLTVCWEIMVLPFAHSHRLRGRLLWLTAAILFMVVSLICVTGCGGFGKPSGRDVPQQSMTFTTQDGVTLSGRVFGAGDVGVVLAHMYAKDQSSWSELAEVLAVEGYQVLAFDFRGYGVSTGTKDIALIDRDIVAAMTALVERGVKRVFVVGASMGGTAALVAAAGENPAGIVALSPPVQFQGLDASKAVSASSCPKLFLAAQGDSAASSTQSLFQLANEPKHIVMLTGSAHGSDLLKGKEGVQAQGLVLDFLTEHAGL